jgi:hypothetical protein
VKTRRGRPPVQAQENAFNNADVVAISSEVTKHHAPQLVKIARRAVLNGVKPDDTELREMLGVRAADDVVASARAIAAAGNRIAAVADDTLRARLKGAVLERLVHDLIAGRATPLREVEVEIPPAGHAGAAWTKPKEIVVDDDPFEVYECKVSAYGLDQGDFDELCDIGDQADGEGVDARPTIAILASERDIRARRATLNLWRPIYFADLEEIADLRYRAATRQLA